MLRRILIALAAVAAIGLASVPDVALARGHGGGGHGGGWHGGGWHGGGWGWGWGGWGAPYWYGPPYYYEPYGCWRRIKVATRHGWRWRRVWVCD